MKKISIIIFITILAFSCGKDGEVGPKGANGADGINGSKGANGDKGPSGNAGLPGDAGKDAFVTALFSDWQPLNEFTLESENASAIEFESSNEYDLTFLPKYKDVSITFFENLKELYIYDDKTKVLLGTLYAYNSFLDKDNKRIIFKNDFRDNLKAFSNSTLGFFNFEGFDLIPSYLETNSILHFKDSYPANTNYLAINKDLDSKIRFIFIPVGLPQKSGRLKKIEKYEDLLEAYGIPNTGSSN
jgi:hypothetical protein